VKSSFVKEGTIKEEDPAIVRFQDCSLFKNDDILWTNPDFCGSPGEVVLRTMFMRAFL